MQATYFQQDEIKMSINLLYGKGTSEKLLKSHKIRSRFYTENTFHKLIYKSKDNVATVDKKNSGDSNQSLK